jgi:hypothetical protein
MACFLKMLEPNSILDLRYNTSLSESSTPLGLGPN